MISQAFSERELQVIQECLTAAVEGPFFPDWEFESLFGVSRDRVAEVAAAWPTVEEGAEEVRLAINNALANLTGYPHGEEEAWERYISVSPPEVVDLLRKWRDRAAATAAGAAEV